MASPDVFAKRMRRRAVELDEGVNRIVRKGALDILTDVVLATPVDTGRARANWLVNIGGPNRSEVEPTSAASAIASGSSTIATRQPNGGDVYISNNLPYIGKLNEGHSKQAPAGFVQTAVLVGSASIRAAAKIFSDS